MSTTTAPLTQPVQTSAKLTDEHKSALRRRRIAKTLRQLHHDHSEFAGWVRHLRSHGATDGEIEYALLGLEENSQLVRELLQVIAVELKTRHPRHITQRDSKPEPQSDNANPRCRPTLPPRRPAELASLTHREAEMLRLAAMGLDHNAIEAQTGIHAKLVAGHLVAAAEKLGLPDRAKVIEFARKVGWAGGVDEL
jgi:DNA-binding NarL/FixJ family response regulator